MTLRQKFEEFGLVEEAVSNESHQLHTPITEL